MNPETAPLAILLMVDESGSINTRTLDMIKGGFSAVIELLGPSDLIGVIAFNHVPEVVVQLQPVGNRTTVQSGIHRIRSRCGGTDLLAALEAAQAQMSGMAACVEHTKHVIVVTDTMFPQEGLQEVFTNLRDDNITVSLVDVLPEGDQSSMAALAKAGGGRHHVAYDTEIGLVLCQEVLRVKDLR